MRSGVTPWDYYRRSVPASAEGGEGHYDRVYDWPKPLEPTPELPPGLL